MANKREYHAMNMAAESEQVRTTELFQCLLIPTYNENERSTWLIPQKHKYTVISTAYLLHIQQN